VSATPVIKVQGLTKKFKDLTAVDNINLEINKGECFGLLGPNGAGKTTLIRMITAVSPATAGEIHVLDYDLKTHPRQAKARLGVVPQNDNLDPDLKTQQNLTTFARYFNIPSKIAKERSLEILKFFELEGKKDVWIEELSGGMKRRLLMARALINEPTVIVLDEPTTGLDPHAKYLLWQKLSDLKSQGITLILCTQNMEEASHLCDRVAIMDLGKILNLDTPENLISQYAGKVVWELWLNGEDRMKIINGLKSRGLEFKESSGKINIFYVDDENSVKSLLSNPDRLVRRPANLEDVFLKLTGRSLEE
jgi:lipooligosaccharide transport system ATP-binding protein